MQTNTEETLAMWKTSYSRGDKAQIQKDTGLSQPTIIKAFKGVYSQKTKVLIDGYYGNKAQIAEKLKTMSL